ncbi:hypothetical protein MIMGU_mgv1a016976mg [Erythranthe guttata]|uniref:Uncharacterized protein n=1 Tax=Erythranthe guttata TaxID=4155 RepID=A0A022PXA3_ERYGU|nr:hypothetical protein MIMGU_mgv1a016976mg [Erythranthe guttata]
MAKNHETEHPVGAFGWAARDTSGVLSPFNFSTRATEEYDVQFSFFCFSYPVQFSFTFFMPPLSSVSSLCVLLYFTGTSICFFCFPIFKVDSFYKNLFD